jgi:putative oxidoreductase
MNSKTMVSVGLLWLRILAGAGMAYHGYGKVLGGHITQMIEGVGKMGFPMPHVFAWAASLSELAGGICLVLGLGTRFAAFFIFITMSVAAFKVHAADSFQVKELALAYWAVSGALMLTGAGSFSFDRFVLGKKD